MALKLGKIQNCAQFSLTQKSCDFRHSFLFIRLYASETSADNLARRCDDDERIGVYLLYVTAQAVCFNTLADRMYYHLFAVRITADSARERGTVAELFDDVLVYFRTLIGNNNEILARIDAFNDGVNEERLHKKTENGKKTCRYSENDERRCRNKPVRNKKRLAFVKVCILFKDKRHDIRAARGRAAVEKYCRAERRKQHSVNKLHKRLIRQGAVRRHCDSAAVKRQNKLQNVCQNGIKSAAKYRSNAVHLAEENKTEYKQKGVQDHDPQTGRYRRKDLTENGTHAADAARCKAVRDFEKVNADRRYRNAESHQKIFFESAEKLAVLV